MKAATISANPITIAMKTERNDILSKPLAVNCQWNFEPILPKEAVNQNTRLAGECIAELLNFRHYSIWSYGPTEGLTCSHKKHK